MSFVSGCLGVGWYQDTQLSIIGKLELKLYQEEQKPNATLYEMTQNRDELTSLIMKVEE